KWLGFVEFSSLPTEALQRGHCYIQDPSTAMACQLLTPQPGEKILDACAAPGGKTTYLAQIMQNRGSIVACERQPQRLRVLEENIKRLQIDIIQVVQHEWTDANQPPAIKAMAPFDRILIDVPCTNTGVMRRRVDVRWRLKPADFNRMRARQIEITRAVIPFL